MTKVAKVTVLEDSFGNTSNYAQTLTEIIYRLNSLVINKGSRSFDILTYQALTIPALVNKTVKLLIKKTSSTDENLHAATF